MNLDELDRAREAPLSEADYDKLKDALHSMAALLMRSPNTEKTSAVVGDTVETAASDRGAPPTGHGRNAAAALVGAPD